MNKIRTYIFCFIIIIVGLNFLNNTNNVIKTKDKYIIDKDSCVNKIDSVAIKDSI